MTRSDTHTIDLDLNFLSQYVKWDSVLSAVTIQVRRARRGNYGVILKIPECLHGLFLDGWACAYLALPPSRLVCRQGWLDRFLGFFGLIRAKGKQVERQVTVSAEAILLLRDVITVTGALVVDGTHIPIEVTAHGGE